MHISQRPPGRVLIVVFVHMLCWQVCWLFSNCILSYFCRFSQF